MTPEEIYKSCNENERFGFAFGLFPIRLSGLSKEESLKLMELSKEEFHQY